MARMSRLLMATAVAAFAAGEASACTESLFRVGKGVHYREYQAPLPGNILMVARTETERLVAEWLAHSGHNVQIVDETDQLAAHLESGKFDVLLAKYADRDAVKAEEAKAGATVKYLPVADDQDTDRLAAMAAYKETVAADSTPRELLKAIHKTLKSDSNVKIGY